MQLLKLPLIKRTRRTHHHILSLPTFRKRIDFTNIWFIFQNHQDTVEAEGEATVWRTAILEGFVHSTEFGFDVGFRFADELESFDEDFGVMIAD